MDGLGEYLKKEREKKGITLEEASKVTRIRKAYLLSIEDGDIGIQSPVFIKGFLKSYAEFLGLDSADVIEKYNYILNEKKDQAGVEKGFELEPVSNRRRYLLPAGLVVALIAAIYILTTSENPDATPAEVQKTAEVGVLHQEPVIPNTTAPIAVITPSEKELLKPMTDTAAPASPLPPKPYVQIVQTPEKPEKQHSLIATARELTWLQVTVDNNDPAEVLLREGESTRWLADSKITIVVGNAGGVDLTYNGKLLESLGPSGKVVTKIFPE
ncbi:MAG: RodZ domain-containing protein [Deltaproteobacteria bacterium]